MDVSQVKVKVKTDVLRNISNDVITRAVRTKDAVNQINVIVGASVNYWEGKGHEQAKNVYEKRSKSIDYVFQNLYSAITDLQKIAGVYEEQERIVKNISGMLLGDIIQ